MVREWMAAHQQELLDMWNTQNFRTLPRSYERGAVRYSTERSGPMFHKIKSVTPLENYRLLVHFTEGCCREYDMTPADPADACFAPCVTFPACSVKCALTPAAMVSRGMMISTWTAPSSGKTVCLCPHL